MSTPVSRIRRAHGLLARTRSTSWPEIEGHFRFNNRDATRNLKRILVRILLGELLVLLTFIELLTNHGTETGVQGMATAANITKSKEREYRICKLRLSLANN